MSAVLAISIVALLLSLGFGGWVIYKSTTDTGSKCTNVCPAPASVIDENCVCQCLNGYTNVNDVCIPIVCPDGYTKDVNGQCIQKTCTTGFAMNSSGMCVPTVTAPESVCPGQATIKHDDATICATTEKSCDGYWINNKCIKKDCSNVKCQNGGTPDSDCVCKCPKGFSGRDCSIVGCLGSNGLPANRCYNGKYDPLTCRCNCDDGFGGTECNIFSGVSNKKDCDKQDKSIWTGLECISTKGESPFPSAGLPRKLPSDYVCYENVSDGYFFVHDRSSPDPWQCPLGDNVHGVIGDDTSYLYGQRCVGGESKEECLDAIAKLV